tara:strand:+ start:842 stop:1306 length:465 start_codon:yes stop_codon:yes gene_type:complete
MDYKKKYLKYKTKYNFAKNILKTGGNNMSYPSTEEKLEQKKEVVRRLEESELEQINDCIKNTKMKKVLCKFKGSNYSTCLENLIKYKSKCLKKAISEFRQFVRPKVKKTIKIKENELLEDDKQLLESQKNKAIEEIKNNSNISQTTIQFLIDNL